MENFFDSQFQFIKQFEVKAQGQPQRKKKWLLSREYLQPLNEPDDEDSAFDDREDSARGYKKKLKCAYEAAKYGMKEGVLTGVFLGGCWGIFKQIRENFTVGIWGLGGVGSEHGGEKNAAGVSGRGTPARSKKSSRIEYSSGSVISTGKNRSPTANSSDVYQDSYKKTMSIIQTKSQEKNYYNATGVNRLINKYPNSKLPIRSEKEFLPLYPGSSRVYDPNRFNFRRSREKVEIVGYAFIQTTGSITNNSSGSGSIESTDSDSPKNTGSITKSGDKNKTSSDDIINKTPSRSSSSRRKSESGTASVIGSDGRKSLQSVRQSVRGSTQSVSSKKSTPKSSILKSTKGSSGSSKSILGSTGELVHSETSARGTEHSRSTLPDVVEETQNTTPISEVHQSEDMFQQLVLEESSSAKDSSLEGMIDKQESKMSGISSITYSNSSYQDLKYVIEQSSSNPTDMYNRRNTGSAFDKPMSESENIYSKKTLSSLADVDAISNGFLSPEMYPQSAKQSQSHFSEKTTSNPPGRHSVVSGASELVSRSPDYINSTSATSKTTTENRSRYAVESSPKIRRTSYSSDKQAEGKYETESMLSQDRSYVSDSYDKRYKVESSPDFRQSHSDARSVISSSPTVDSEVQQETRRSTRESFLSNSSYIEKTPDERFRSGSSPSHSKSHVSESQEEKVFTVSNSPTKSYNTGVLQDEKITREESFNSRSYVLASENKSTGGSKYSASLFSGQGRGSVSSSVKSHTSARHSQEKYSGGSPAHSKSVRSNYDNSSSLFKDQYRTSKESTAGSYPNREQEVSVAAMAEVSGPVGLASPPKKATPDKGGGSCAVEEKEDAEKKYEKSSRGFSFLSAINENVIVLSACNCAIVLGVVCSVISTTRASLSV